MSTVLVWSIAAATLAGILFRPKEWPEAVWACLGALLLIVSGLLPISQASAAVAKGTDVYLFLTGMMLLSELARREGVFDWLASHAVAAAKGSRVRLFGLVYLVGIAVTVFLSNDATAVVLTPALYAAVQKARTKPLPYLFICAFIANAASFVLPIANPANLVVYGKQVPPLIPWLRTFLLPSICSIAATFAALRWTLRADLRGELENEAGAAGRAAERADERANERAAGRAAERVGERANDRAAGRAEGRQTLSRGGRLAAWGIATTGAILIGVSALGLDLGLPTFISAAIATLAATRAKRGAVGEIVRGVSWSVLPVVAGLFVVVEALNRAGALQDMGRALEWCARMPRVAGGLAASFGIAALSNVMNNLPSGLLAGGALQTMHVPASIRDSVLIGVDLGPNLSVTGSLATVLWLIALRREGQQITGWQFLKTGLIVMPPALLLSTLCLALLSK
jgi:arsenical pump membrane protein